MAPVTTDALIARAIDRVRAMRTVADCSTCRAKLGDVRRALFRARRLLLDLSSDGVPLTAYETLIGKDR